MNEQAATGHEIVLADRTRMNVSGVGGVDCFNEEMIVLDTAAGTLTVSGEALNLSSLDLQAGRVQISGRLRALEYADQRPLRGGLLKKIFR